MKKSEKYNFAELGAEFGIEVANCSENLIQFLVEEKMRMINASFGIKAAVDFRTGAYTAVNYLKSKENKQVSIR